LLDTSFITLFSAVRTNKLPHSHKTSITPWKVPVKAEGQKRTFTSG